MFLSNKKICGIRRRGRTKLKKKMPCYYLDLANGIGGRDPLRLVIEPRTTIHISCAGLVSNSSAIVAPRSTWMNLLFGKVFFKRASGDTSRSLQQYHSILINIYYIEVKYRFSRNAKLLEKFIMYGTKRNSCTLFKKVINETKR